MITEVNESTVEATQEVGTTERLFGAEEAEEHIEVEPAKTVEQKAAEPQKVSEPGKQDSEYLPVEALGDKKVKVKVGGEEKDINFRELLKGYQTDQYLTQKGQKIADEYRALQAKANPEPPRGMPLENKVTEPDDDFYREYVKPFVEVQNKEISNLKQELNRLQNVTGPLEYQNNLAKVEADMKAQGYDDFMKHIPEIQTRILNMPVEQQMAYDTDWGFKSIYKDIKLAEYRQAISSKPGTKLPDQRPQPRVVNVEGGGGSPSGTDDSLSTLNRAFQKATKSGRTQDWADFVSAKYGA